MSGNIDPAFWAKANAHLVRYGGAVAPVIAETGFIVALPQSLSHTSSSMREEVSTARPPARSSDWLCATSHLLWLLAEGQPPQCTARN